jgi:hypothetical protein
MRKALISLAIALLAGGCATSYQLQLMPRDSGKLYQGFAEGSTSAEGRISITIEDKVYNGTWVSVVPERSTGYVSGGFGYGRWGYGYGAGFGSISMDNPNGGEAKALLTAADGSGLRCDFRGSWGSGGGVCRDDKGRDYDVQMRSAPPKG